MRFLVTSSRMPFAIDTIRKLGTQGHTVFASDTFSSAPGSHSRYVAESIVTASPRYDTRRFVEDVVRALRDHDVDMLLPQFEEVFYLAKHRAELAPWARAFMPSFESLALLHNKATLHGLAQSLNIRVPRSVTATSQARLAEAIAGFEGYFARPVYSRGGIQLFTNLGPLAGATKLDECRPSAENPWVVQQFVEGEDVCTFSIAHHGRIAAHAAYVHPREIEHAGGIVFESVEEPESLAIAQAIVAATKYDGQISLDFRRTSLGLVLIECNPRPTAGIHVMSASTFERALLGVEPDMVLLAEPGVRCKYSVALIRDMLLHWRELPADLKHLMSSAKEVVADSGDLAPALYQLISYRHVQDYRHRLHTGKHKATDLMAAYFDDICWNGEPIA
jgi:predicted ATP-grasp superfamily ATP-dependent carboligase